MATFVPIVRVDRPVVGQLLPEIPPEDSVHQLTSSAILTEKNAGLWIRIRKDLHYFSLPDPNLVRKI